VTSAQSPYEAVLGERFGDVHPTLQRYFSAIEPGTIGCGEGVFTIVGTPRWWLRAAIRMIVPRDVMFPVWEHEVPFTVINTPVQAAESPAVTGERTFSLATGDRVMRDCIAATPEGLVDTLGVRCRFRALFAADIVGGDLHLTSTRVAMRIGARHVRIPRLCAPRVTLIERYSAEDHRQHVAVVVSAPLIGRVYEYAGSFRYELRAERP
jgi:Domain of unknown function (DUF4166)